jgi:Tfp pilus assembly protein PilF
LERARLTGPSLEGLLDLALAYHLAGDVGAEVSAAEAATQIDPEAPEAWSAYAHALARTDRASECERASRFCNFRRAGHGSDQTSYNPRYATRDRLHASGLG